MRLLRSHGHFKWDCVDGHFITFALSPLQWSSPSKLIDIARRYILRGNHSKVNVIKSAAVLNYFRCYPVRNPVGMFNWHYQCTARSNKVQQFRKKSRWYTPYWPWLLDFWKWRSSAAVHRLAQIMIYYEFGRYRKTNNEPGVFIDQILLFYR